MDAFGSVKIFFDILNSLWKNFTELRQADAKRIGQIFSVSVEPSFQQLTTIHDDYTRTFSKLRDHLRDRSLPPRSLLIWLRDAGLQYRGVRDNLWTIDTELRSPETPAFNGLEKRHADFITAFQRYIRSVIEYYRCTVSWYGATIYRSSERTLQAVLDSIGETQASDGEAYKHFVQFYEHIVVTDLIQELTMVCDVRLPQHWQAVCRAFREVRTCVGDAI
jgi:hypothetical protein